jgi:hypothetical protein
MAAKSYMVDCYYAKDGKLPDETSPDESFHIKAGSDDEAIKEASIHAGLRKPTFYRLRITSRNGDQIIFRSSAQGPIPDA